MGALTEMHWGMRACARVQAEHAAAMAAARQAWEEQSLVREDAARQEERRLAVRALRPPDLGVGGFWPGVWCPLQLPCLASVLLALEWHASADHRNSHYRGP